MQGHIRKRVHTTKAGSRTINWYVVVDVPLDNDGRRRQKWFGGYPTRREAEAERAKIVHEMNLGSFVEPSALTLAEWVRGHWLHTMESRVKASTFDSYRRNLELHVLPRLGSLQLRRLTPVMLNGLYSELLADGNLRVHGGLSPKTVRYIHTIIHKALADALDAGMLGANVAARAKPPRPRTAARNEISVWDPADLRQFLGMVDGDRLEAAWHLIAMTGMRRGEVLGLRWRDVDLDAARLSVRQALVAVAYKVIVSTPKSHQARVIDLDSGTVARLRAHGARQQVEREEWGTGCQDLYLVFCKEDGTPFHPHTFSQAFERIVERSSLPKLRLHDLRHTHATIALKAGVPIKVISERLGHETPAFTMKQYAHVIPGMQAEAAAMVARLVADPGAQYRS